MTCQAAFCTNEFTSNYYCFGGKLVCPECYVKLIQIAPRCAFCDTPIPHRPYVAYDKSFCSHRCASNWFITRPKKVREDWRQV